jgi:copper chaperone CopZ
MSASVSLTVNGMKCGGCETNVTAKLTALPGVISVKASHIDKRIDIDYLAEQINLDEIEEAIEAAGFSVE